MSTEEGQGPVMDDGGIAAGKAAPSSLEEEPSTFTLALDDGRGQATP